MLQMKLPLAERRFENQPVGNILPRKTIRLYVATHEDFHTAVSYLSKHAGLRHIDLHKVAVPSGAAALQSEQPSLSTFRALSASSFSTMPPPSRPPSQGLHTIGSPAPSAGQLPTRTATSVARMDSGQPTRRPVSARPMLNRMWSQTFRNPSRDRITRGGSIQPGQLHGQSPVEAASGDLTHTYDGESQNYLSQSGYRNIIRPVDYSDHELSLSQENAGFDEQGVRSLNHGTHLRGIPNPSGHLRSATLNNSSPETYYHQQPHLLSSPHQEFASRDFRGQPQSRPGSASQLGVPVKIQFLEPSSRHAYTSSNPKTLWELTLNLLPSTKTWELCHHAASHISRKFGRSLEGMTFEAQDIDGQILEVQDSISRIISKGATVFLTECVLESTHRLHKDLSLDLGSSQEVRPATDTEVQVPPPRRLPFTSVSADTATATAQTTAFRRSPLAERSELANRNSTTAVQEVSPPPSLEDKSGSVVSKKRSRQGSRASTAKRSRPASRHPASPQDRPGTILEKDPPPVHTGEHSLLQKATRQAELPGVMTRSAAAQLSKSKSTGNQQQAEVVPAATEAEIADTDRRCMGCRNKRWQCDGSIPTCGPCKQSGRKCIYPKPQVDGAGKYNKEDMHRSTTSRGQNPVPAPIMQDAATQVLATTQDAALQTVEANYASKDVELKDTSTNTFIKCVDAAVETAKCDNMWLPYSQSLELVSWTKDRYDEQLKKAANVLRTSDISREDYRDKAQLAAQYLLDLEWELRQICEKALANTS